MNPWAEPIGIALILVAVGAALLVVAARNRLQRRRWVAIATAILAALVVGLFALLAGSYLQGPGD